MAPRNTEELIVWRAILGTWPAYITGTLYIVAPVVAWCLVFVLVKRFMLHLCDAGNHAKPRVGLLPLIWIIGMVFMEIALIVGQVNHHYGLPLIIKSTIGWAKGWALLAIFILIGSLNIRTDLIIRACSLVCIHTLCIFPICVIAWLIGFNEVLFISPAQVVGGPGPEFFEVRLYEIDPSTGFPRWRLFTPWAPALGMVGNVYFVMCLYEKRKLHKYLGLFGSVLMVLISFSRLGIIALFSVAAVTYYMSLMSRPAMLWISGIFTMILGIIAPAVLASVDFVVEKFRSARAGSSRVRSTLAQISLERWREEAPWWGHGVMERGPHLVEYMMIGSHHTWFGLLYVKGIMGFLSLAIPMFITFLATWRSSFYGYSGRIALCVVLILFAYSFGENLEILAYLIWPGLVIIGISCSKQSSEVKSQVNSAASTH